MKTLMRSIALLLIGAGFYFLFALLVNWTLAYLPISRPGLLRGRDMVSLLIPTTIYTMQYITTGFFASLVAAPVATMVMQKFSFFLMFSLFLGIAATWGLFVYDAVTFMERGNAFNMVLQLLQLCAPTIIIFLMVFMMLKIKLRMELKRRQTEFFRHETKGMRND